MFRLEQAQGLLLLLFEFEQALLEAHVLLEVYACFARKVDGPVRIAERGKLLFGGIELGLHARELLLEEVEGLLRLGAAHLDVLLQVGIRDGIQDVRHTVRIGVLHRNADNSGILALFRDAQATQETGDRHLRMSRTQEAGLARTGLHGTHANGKRIARIGLTIGFPDLALQ